MKVLHRLSSNSLDRITTSSIQTGVLGVFEKARWMFSCVARGGTDSCCTGFEELRGPIAHLEISRLPTHPVCGAVSKKNAMHQSSNGNQAKKSSEVRAQSDLCSGGVELNLHAGSLQTGTRMIILVMAKF
jgi:hypothetical protein